MLWLSGITLAAAMGLCNDFVSVQASAPNTEPAKAA
jgi:hypothetical protein